MEHRFAFTEFLWPQSRSAPQLDGGHVHVWRSKLDVSSATFSVIQNILSGDELRRAGRYYFEKHRRRFVAARGFLRTVLSIYLERKPEDVRFCYNAYGKPLLIGSAYDEKISFNLSHSHDLALCAVTFHGRIGIDVELVRSDLDWRQIARGVFSDKEYATITSFPEEIQRAAFFRQWTLKEAYIKARGEGLSLPLRSFDISKGQDDIPYLFNVEDTAMWEFFEFDPAQEYVAAVAVEGSILSVSPRYIALAATGNNKK